MRKNKPKQVEVNSEMLIGISVKLLDDYDIAPNIQSILLLSYLTVKEFSRKQEHLDKNAKLDLCIQYTPDLITSLFTTKLIASQNDLLMISLQETFKNNIEDMRNTLEAYYVMSDYKIQTMSASHTKQCCLK